MITISSPKGASIRCEWDKKVLAVFPDENKKTADALITLLKSPEEESQEGVISWPGEYDIEEIAIRGIGHKEGAQVSFAVEMDGVRFGFLSSPLAEWSDYELELLGDIDVLVITANKPKVVQKLVDEIDPRILIPVPNGDKDVFDEVLNVCGAKGQEVVTEYKVKGLPAEGRTVVVLKKA